MFFTRLLKNFLITLGFLLIGVGIGTIVAENFQVEKTNYWLIIVFALVLGGFFTALGIAKKTPKEIEESEESEEPEELEETGSAESSGVPEENKSSEEKVEF